MSKPLFLDYTKLAKTRYTDLFKNDEVFDAIVTTITEVMNDYQNETLKLYDMFSVGKAENYGLDFMKESYGYDLDMSVKCSNFIGETIDMAADMGFKRMLLTGHIGKLIKVAGGIMNTHSREADCRIELLTAFAFKCGVAPEYIKRIMDSLTTEEALAALKESGRLYEVMDYAMERICFYLDKRAKGRLEIDCIMYSNEFGELAKSRKAEKWFTLLAQEQAQQI